MSWEERFQAWSRGPSQSETERCENAIRAIKDAINASDALRQRNVTVFLQGSYRNRVNVRQDSDVDIGVLCNSVHFANYPDGMSGKDFGVVDSDYTYATFKRDVGEALLNRFGPEHVTLGSKAFDIKSNTYRVEADVAAFFEHRRYYPNSNYTSGVELRSSHGGRVINWPEQHYTNSTNKNARNARRYKRIVRILKKINYEMQTNNVPSSQNIPGFLCECLVWNVPDKIFDERQFSNILRDCLAYLYEQLNIESSNEWGEVSELKYLFSANQKWTKQQAINFVVGAYNYVGFGQ
ncbi:nucleotidyltransferase [Thalassospira australica]|uniref:nucleotidyltransferase domain-containing protein n=1 Tax=Thalassospira australica TaxID=1528106 RepID=UPI000519F4A1|nr:nucleotidyltransferase [Thalassospira australica]